LNVIIPTHNRADQLRTCLQGLGRQTQAVGDFEVTVVMDGSTDGTQELLTSLRTPFRLRAIYQPRSGQHVARNRGVADSSGRYCLFLDDDIDPSPGLIAAHLAMLRTRSDTVGLGAMPMTVDPGADWFGRWFAQQWDERYARLEAGLRVPRWVDCYGGNLSLPRTAFEKVGGFASDMPASHDIELGYRLQRQGLSFVYLPEAVGIHAERKTGRELKTVLERHGRAAVALYRRHPEVLPDILGSFGQPSRRIALARRLLLALHVSPTLLSCLGPTLCRVGRQRQWSHFVASYCYWFGVRGAIGDSDFWRRLTQATPILLYHAFAAPGEPASRFVMPVGRFARQMAWLKLGRYRVIPLEELVRCRREFRVPPARAVVLTIDDGYADNVQLALPVLQRYGFPATVFVVSGRVGGTNQWSSRPELVGRPLASWSDLHHLVQAGLTIGAHSRSHPVLPSLPEALAREEIEGSRHDLQAALTRPVEVFAYPYGTHNERVQALAEKAGFLASCGVGDRLNDSTTHIHALDRTEIRGTDSLFWFVLRMVTGYPGLLRRREARRKGRSTEVSVRAS
jgi:peptidoglycan/xylan/chitin deacetylase (PgdA/CDA1 family)/GT2 family glycosyltransferase